MLIIDIKAPTKFITEFNIVSESFTLYIINSYIRAQYRLF